jgi:hypothetical protein
MDDARNAGLVALVLVAATCLAIYLLGATEPTGAVVEFFFPRS